MKSYKALSGSVYGGWKKSLINHKFSIQCLAKKENVVLRSGLLTSCEVQILYGFVWLIFVAR